MYFEYAILICECNVRLSVVQLKLKFNSWMKLVKHVSVLLCILIKSIQVPSSHYTSAPFHQLINMRSAESTISDMSSDISDVDSPQVRQHTQQQVRVSDTDILI
jgi:hypothetical protein